jgi:hypothetical protein
MNETFRRWQIGDVSVTRVIEDIDDEIMHMVVPQATPEALAEIPWLRPHFVGEHGRAVLSIHALVVETRDRRILVDTCLGNDKERSTGCCAPTCTSITSAGTPSGTRPVSAGFRPSPTRAT